MKLKYYLRGLGIGIIVTAVIMSVIRKPEELTDAQIKMRALELGMVEENVLADLKNESDSPEEVTVEDIVNEDNAEVSEKPVENEEAAAEEDNAEETVETEQPIEEEPTSEAEEVTDEEADSETEESAAGNDAAEVPKTEGDIENSIEKPQTDYSDDSKNTQETSADREEKVENYIIISVKKGNGSENVSRKLYEAGLVNSPEQYNRFLVENGYDRRLRIGNHEIPIGATDEEMAKILCGMK